jgi:hypothetical protein
MPIINLIKVLGGEALADKDEPGVVDEKVSLAAERIERRLDMLDGRLDNIDSTVSAIVERVMSQAATLNITCPKCGKDIEIAIIGGHKPTV